MQRVFRAIALGELDDEAVSSTVFRPVPGLLLDQVAQPESDGSWSAGQCVARLTEGVGCEGTIDSSLTAVLTAMDGTATLADATRAAAERLGLEPNELLTPARAMARGLYQQGFLDRQEDLVTNPIG